MVRLSILLATHIVTDQKNQLDSHLYYNEIDIYNNRCTLYL